jgi:hypothetical protein
MQARNRGFANVRRLPIVIVGLLLVAAPPALSGSAAACTRDDFAKVVDETGAALRRSSAENTPRLRAKMRRLKTRMGWPESDSEEKAYQALHDERIAALDAAANKLLAKIDTLGTVGAGAAPDCGKLPELSAASLELQATVKTKTAYLLSKLDQMLGDPLPLPKTGAKTGAAPDAEPKPAAKPPVASGWSTKTTGEPPREVAVAPAPADPPAPAAEEGYTIEEIRAASAGFFGKLSANLGSAIEHVFRNSGRPTAYILGNEGGGAFLAGVRYGKGILYPRSGGTQEIFWHGPTLGVDVGGEGSKTLFLIYKLAAPEELYTGFTGVDGSAYLVGGVGVRLVTNGRVVMAPIRSGLGLRLGASIGYIRFTPKATWNPF